MEKQGWVSIWLGNIKNEDLIDEYVDLTYDEDGDSIPSPFFIDFNIDIDETDEDTIEKAIYKSSHKDLCFLLEGCSYDDMIIPKIKKRVNLLKSYNAIILIYNFYYNNEIRSADAFDFIAAISYEEF
ncbi:immunity 22 family protein [Bacillus sp. Cs-700]|uniref:immunity 22 family protein n=1 Tax=Bacillus sp. Cs-700 TaxID=2589818 RepID=UPI001409991F|nr:immunity 22 family protein [Bacillus sp. Cs-700]